MIFVRSGLANRRMPTVFRMWLLIDAAEYKALVKWSKNKMVMSAHFRQKADRWKRLTAPRPEWWLQYF